MPPQPQDVLPPTGSELPAPIHGTAASSAGPQLISPSANRAGVKPVSKTAPAPMPQDNARSTLKINGANQAVTPNHTDSQVRQASAAESFDWGALALGASAEKPVARASVIPSTATSQWASARSTAAEPNWVPSSGDAASTGWKQAQR
jgi:hypothetical protein